MGRGYAKKALGNANRLPKPIFTKIEQLDRLRNYMLGLPIENKARTIPFGYIVSETDPSMLEPVDYEFELLVEAKKLLKFHSYKDVSEWLTVNSGRTIKDAGLHQIMERRAPDKRAALTREEREQV